MAKHDYPLKRYGQWAGDPKGRAYDPARCANEVFVNVAISQQCSRPAGHGDRKLFCRQHAKRYPAEQMEKEAKK